MIPPTIREALGLGWRATVREAWLAPVAMAVSFARAAIAFAPLAFSLAIVAKAAGVAAARAVTPAAAATDLVHALASPRLLAVVAGLWLSATLLAAALRVAYLSGSLSMLGWALAGAGGAPGFSTGVAYRFPAVAGAAILGWLMDLGASLFAGASAVAAIVITVHPGTAPPGLAAALGAACLAGAGLLAGATSVVGDAAVARAAIRSEGPLLALAAAWSRFARRPAAFLVVLAVAEAASLVVLGSMNAFASAATGLAAGADPRLLAGPRLVLSSVLALLAALLELWRLGAIAVLACGRERGET